ncbi:MAG: class I SAM-dependent methyltransferase [Acidobacteriaceae bacterium]|jgi:ubiquinone/menaquinone biosynthesis C-methylase UbiE|nr:class I SAM-dependent methyltransferase [Acidobacteriaceae bacterium]
MSESDHKEKFSGRVNDYVAYRSRYSRQLIAIMKTKCGLCREHVIADVGAGTGMFAELFLAHGNRVIAVEPNVEMMQERMKLQARYARLQVVKASAEETTLADVSVDFIAAGRAFHWFDAERAKVEFKRIIKPGGWVILASVGRRRGDTPLECAYEELLLHAAPAYVAMTERFKIYNEPERFFGKGHVLREAIESMEAMTLAMLEGQTRSLSCAPLQNDPGYEVMRVGLAELFRSYAKDGVVHMPVISQLTCGQFSA